jgi:folate-binding protein YgfZ
MITEYYNAARTQAALAEKDWSGLVKFTGSERASWLQGMVTNDVQKLQPAQGCFAAHLTPQGKIVAQMHILADDDSLWFSLERAVVPKLMAAFEKLLITEDVQMSDVSDQWEALAVVGPKSREVIESWLGEPLNLSETYSHKAFSQCRVVVSELGFEVWVLREVADKALRALAASGATAIDHGTWDVLRTEAGIPMYGVDIDESTTLPELGDHGISYEKGCYVGQEVVAKVKYIGHVNRRFSGLVLNGNQLPDTKSAIRKDGKDVGYITTSVFSPGLNKPIALGFVSRTAYAPGTDVEVLSEGRTLKATISNLPFDVAPIAPHSSV